MRRSIKFILGSLITLTILYFLLKDLPITQFQEVSKNFSLSIIVLTFLTYFVMNLFRAIRIKRLFSNLKFITTINIVFIHNMINNILPFRIGEVSYIYMIKKEKNSSQAISSLVTLRFFDLIAVFIIFTISILFIDFNKTIMNIFFTILGLIVILSVLIITFKRTNILKWDLIKKIKKSLFNLNTALTIKLLIDSLMIWTLSFVFYYIFIQSFNINLTFFEVSIASILIILSAILPINGIAGLGTTELAWTIGLVIFGIDKDVAIISGLVIHIFRIIYFVILGLIGLIGRQTSRKKI